MFKDFFKNKAPLWLLSGLFVLVIAFTAGRCTGPAPSAPVSSTNGQLEQHIVLGKLHAMTVANQVALHDWKNSQDSTMQEMRTEIGKNAELITATQARWRTTGQATVPIRDTIVLAQRPGTNQVDTIQTKGFDFDDGWLSARVALVRKDSAALAYSYNSDVRLYTYWRKNGWLKPPSLMAKLVNDNPNAHVTQLSSWVIAPPKPAWHQTRGAAFAAGMFCGAAGTTALALAVR